jgi:hypothetical protein
MKLAKVAKMIDADRRTVYNWVTDPMLKRFFSDSSQDEGDRELDEQDVIVANTIRFLRKDRTTTFEEIAKKLESGYRNTDLALGAVTVDTGKTPLQQFTRTLTVVQERDEAQKQLAEAERELVEAEARHGRELKELKENYEQRLDDERQQNRLTLEAERERYNNKTESLLREIAELKYEIGKLEPREESGKHRSSNNNGA